MLRLCMRPRRNPIDFFSIWYTSLIVVVVQNNTLFGVVNVSPMYVHASICLHWPGNSFKATNRLYARIYNYCINTPFSSRNMCKRVWKANYDIGRVSFACHFMRFMVSPCASDSHKAAAHKWTSNNFKLRCQLRVGGQWLSASLINNNVRHIDHPRNNNAVLIERERERERGHLHLDDTLSNKGNWIWFFVHSSWCDGDDWHAEHMDGHISCH